MSGFLIKISKPIILVIGVISLFMYYTCPVRYDYNLCLSAFIMMIIVAVFLILKVSNRQVLTFDLLFTVAFVFANFLYPVFLYPINPKFSLFAITFNEDYITKCSFMALLGFSSYSFFRVRRYKNRTSNLNNATTANVARPAWAIALCSIITIITIVFYGRSIGTLYSDFKPTPLIELLRNILDALIFYLILAAFFKSRSLKEVFKKLPFLFWILLILLCLVQLLIGVRTYVLRYGMVIIFGYSYFIKRIKLLPVILLVVAGMVLMHDVGNKRMGTEGREISDSAVINAGEDLIINNRALYAITEIADRDGLTYGKSMLMNVLSVVPFAQSIIPPLVGSDINEMSSALINTGEIWEPGNPNRIGLGTNTIADIYLAFGVLGVIILMGILGALISKSEAQMYQSFGYLLVYALFFANAIYYPRAEYLNLLRIITWNYIFYYIINKTNRASRKQSRGTNVKTEFA